MSIEYRTLARYQGYKFGSDGSVWSCHRSKGRWWQMNPRISDGYRRVDIRAAGEPKWRSVRVCRLILEAFVGPAPHGMEACHYPDPTRTNDRIENLKWGTRKENANEAKIHETNSQGERHGMSKLTAHDVLEIRELRQQGKKLAEIAALYGIDFSNVSKICRRRTWAWL